MKLLLCLLTLTLASGAAGQTFSAEQFGRSLRFSTDSFDPAQTSVLLGQPLPRTGIRIRTPSVLNANLLKTAFADSPARFGYRCSGDQEVLLFPGTGQDARPYLLGLLQNAGVQTLAQTATETLFSAGGNVFARFSIYNGVFLLTACQATRDFTALNFNPGTDEAFTGTTPYLITADAAGGLNWCTGTARPQRSVQAFTGSTTAVDVSTDGARVAVGGWDARPAVKIYEAATGTLTQTLALTDGPVSLSFSGDARSLLVLDSRQTYTWFDLTSGRVLKTWSVPSLLISHLLGGGPNLFLEWAMGSTLRVYQAEKGTGKFSLRNFKLSAQTFTPDGKWLVTADFQGVLRAYSTVDGAPGPQVSVGALAGVGLMAGASGSQVIALLRETAEGKLPRVTASAWTIGEPGLVARGTTEHPSGNFIVMNQARTAIASVTRCVSH